MLPGELVADLDLEGLTPVPGSFVDEALLWRHCDLLFTTRCRGRDAFVYVLVEHQSSPDRWMAWRMLRYVSRIGDRYLVDHPHAETLPLVVPVVVHHGQSPWPHPTSLESVLDIDPGWLSGSAVGELVPRFRFLLDDLSAVDERTLRARPLTAPARLTLLLLARARANQALARELTAWVADLRAVLDRPGGLETFRALLTYIEVAGEVPPDDLRRVMAQVGPDAEEAYVTTADMLRAEGEVRGRAETLLQLLEMRFGPVPAETAAAVRGATVQRIEAWTARVLTAGSLDDVLA